MFEICIGLAVLGLGISLMLLARRCERLETLLDGQAEAVANAACAVSEQRKNMADIAQRLNELEGITAEAAENEKRFQDGLNRLMDYNIDVAMGGNSNG